MSTQRMQRINITAFLDKFSCSRMTNLGKVTKHDLGKSILTRAGGKVIRIVTYDRLNTAI
jgi:hypothetical protein